MIVASQVLGGPLRVIALKHSASNRYGYADGEDALNTFGSIIPEPARFAGITIHGIFADLEAGSQCDLRLVTSSSFNAFNSLRIRDADGAVRTFAIGDSTQASFGSGLSQRRWGDGSSPMWIGNLGEALLWIQ